MSQKSTPLKQSAADKSAEIIPSPDEAEIVRRILQALAGLEYGSVEIIVQGSKVVQIERTQRSRFSQPLDIPKAD